MNPLKSFEEFLNEGIIKKQRLDISRASSLRQEAEKRKSFLNVMVDKIKVSDDNANYFVENSYDIVMELIRAKLLLNGFKASGINAHEAEVSYLRVLGFSEYEVRFVNELRYFRNGIIYYGKRLDADYANRVLNFLDTLYVKLREL